MQPPTLILYDGQCGLCNRFVYFLLARDRDARLRFAPLQGRVARETLERCGYDPTPIETIYAVAASQAGEERVLARSTAVLHAVAQLGPKWHLVSHIARMVPTPLADAVYRVVATHRYRIWGRSDRCPVPPAGWRTRFLD